MSNLTGITVTLTTAADEDGGTDDHVYLGVIGLGGGREFPLDDADWEDFELEEPIKYKLGETWETVGSSRSRASPSQDKSTIRRSCPSNLSWSMPCISGSGATTPRKMTTHIG